jgi:hypothetical protein
MKKQVFLVLEHLKVPGFVSVTNNKYSKSINPSRIKEDHMTYKQYRVIGYLSDIENNYYNTLDDNKKLKFIQELFPSHNITSIPITDMYLYNKTVQSMITRKMLKKFNRKTNLFKNNKENKIAIIKKQILDKNNEITELKNKLKKLLNK